MIPHFVEKPYPSAYPFVSESLAWSLYSSKRYLEETDRFSHPGSFAEKKTFFEARMGGNNENESKSNISMHIQCVGDSCTLDFTKIRPKEEMKHGEMNSMPYSESSELSQEALLGNIKEESSETENPPPPPQKRKTTITWLMPECISPAAISSKYRSSIAKSDKKAPKSHIPSIDETKSDPKRFFLAAQFSKLWSKCRTKLLCSLPSRLGSKGKSPRNNKEEMEKKLIEKKPRKWFQCLCFNSGLTSTDQKEKSQSEDRKKRMAVTCPKLCIKN